MTGFKEGDRITCLNHPGLETSFHGLTGTIVESYGHGSYYVEIDSPPREGLNGKFMITGDHMIHHVPPLRDLDDIEQFLNEGISK